MLALSDTLDVAFDGVDIDEDQRQKVRTFMNVLRLKDESTYEHSVRVAALSSQIGKFVSLNPKPLFLAGCFHDLGKALIRPEVLKKKESFTKQDMEEMKGHVIDSYRLVRGTFDFSAEIVLRHHLFQAEGYPEVLPTCRVPFCRASKVMIDYYARMLSLADFYDAASSRENDKFGDKKRLNQDEVRSLMLKHNKDQVTLINQLYDHHILGGEPTQTFE
jgi:HD-GYP domain-containing protein (c-di-GMP phosphodiesterase class II)